MLVLPQAISVAVGLFVISYEWCIENSGGIEGKDVYNSKREKLVLALLLKPYSKLDTISVGASSILLVCLILFTNYLYYLLLL